MSYMANMHVYIGRTAIWAVPNVEQKIASFARLAKGWDYGRGGPIPEKTRTLAMWWNQFLRTQGAWDDLSTSRAQQAIREVVEKAWSASDCYIPTNTTLDRGSSPVPPSGIQKTTSLYQLWNGLVSRQQALPHVTILESTIPSQPLWGIHHSSGSLTQQFYLLPIR